jgi:hypothetical protein
MSDWLDDNCGVNGWAIGPARTRGIGNDAVAVYLNSPTCAVAFVARWCVPGNPPGLYEFREKGRRVGSQASPTKARPSLTANDTEGLGTYRQTRRIEDHYVRFRGGCDGDCLGHHV